MNELVRETYNSTIKNKLYGLLCEFEKKGEWEKFLDTILIECLGFPADKKTAIYYTLFYKLTSLRYLRYEYFRSTIFDCMNLVDEL